MKNTIKEITKRYFATMLFVVGFILGVTGMVTGIGDILLFGFVLMLAMVRPSLDEVDAMEE